MQGVKERGAKGAVLKKERKKAEKHERQRKALELRKAGMTYALIATSLDVDPSTAHRLVKSALNQIVDEPADDLRKMMDERLNTMLMVTWPQVQGGDGQAIDRAMRIMDRQATLRGLNAPQEINIQSQTTHVLEVGGDIDDYRESLRAYRIQALGESDDKGNDDDKHGGEPHIIEAEVVDDTA